MVKQAYKLRGFLMLTMLWTGSVLAQDWSALEPVMPRIATLFDKLGCKSSAFSADATVELTETGNPQPMSLPSRFVFVGPNMRWEIDAGKASGSDLPPEITAALRRAKLDKICLIDRFDKKVSYVVFAGVGAYLSNSIPTATASNILTQAASVKFETETLGKELVDGFDCTKKKMTIPAEAGLHEYVLVWTAAALSNYPVKLVMVTAAGNVNMHFRNVKFDPPPPDTFEVSANFVCKTDSQEIIEFAKQLRDGLPANKTAQP
jgi:hypothetical protein